MKLLYRIINKLSKIQDIMRIREYKKYINGSGYRLDYGVYLQYPEKISIGEGTYINSGRIYASPNATITIGKNCLISYNVHMRTDSHNYRDKKKLIQKQGYNERDIVIGDDVWIGYGAQIMPGCVIGGGGVIGAGAVVTHSTEPYCVYAGIPAKKITERI